MLKHQYQLQRDMHDHSIRHNEEFHRIKSSVPNSNVPLSGPALMAPPAIPGSLSMMTTMGHIPGTSYTPPMTTVMQPPTSRSVSYVPAG
jgi:hypothetical protein